MIELHQVKKHYRNHIVSYKDTIIKSKITVVLGKNGTGKTTLLQAIANLIAYDGSIMCSDSTLYVPTEFEYPYDVRLTELLDTLFLETKTKADYIVAFSLTKHLQKYCHQLSNGMRQKVKLLFPILLSHKIVLLDEPFLGLDDKAIDVLKRWMVDSNKQIVIATHQIKHIASLSKEVISL